MFSALDRTSLLSKVPCATQALIIPPPSHLRPPASFFSAPEGPLAFRSRLGRGGGWIEGVAGEVGREDTPAAQAELVWQTHKAKLKVTLLIRLTFSFLENELFQTNVRIRPSCFAAFFNGCQVNSDFPNFLIFDRAPQPSSLVTRHLFSSSP